MCRWMAYSGESIVADDLLFRPKHSIIDQSLHAEQCGFPGAWNEVPEGSWALVRGGENEIQSFQPVVPA
jgi:hypothetical protein